MATPPFSRPNWLRINREHELSAAPERGLRCLKGMGCKVDDMFQRLHSLPSRGGRTCAAV